MNNQHDVEGTRAGANGRDGTPERIRSAEHPTKAPDCGNSSGTHVTHAFADQRKISLKPLDLDVFNLVETRASESPVSQHHPLPSWRLPVTMHLPRLIRRKVALLFGLAFMFSAMPAYTQTYQRSFYKMTTGNGHGFQVFDRQAGSITSFLEHPYLFIAPFDNARDGGLERRNLTYKTYFGLTVNGQTQWLENLQNVQYEAQTHIIKATTTVNGADVEVGISDPSAWKRMAWSWPFESGTVPIATWRSQPSPSQI